MGMPDDARTAVPRPKLRTSRHLRRTKLVTAFAITALVGIGSYAATYEALIMVSTPTPATGSIAPAPSGSTGSVPPPATPAQAHP